MAYSKRKVANEIHFHYCHCTVRLGFKLLGSSVINNTYMYILITQYIIEHWIWKVVFNKITKFYSKNINASIDSIIIFVPTQTRVIQSIMSPWLYWLFPQFINITFIPPSQNLRFASQEAEIKYNILWFITIKFNINLSYILNYKKW